MTLAQQTSYPHQAPAIARRVNVHGGIGLLGVTLAVAGGITATAGARQGGVLGWLIAAGGAALTAAGIARHPSIRRAVEATPFEEETAQRRGWKTASAVASSITIMKPRAEIYRFWRDLPNLSRIMEPIEDIRKLDEDGQTTRWVVKAPGGSRVSWTANITEDEPDTRLAWESAPRARLRNAGWVEFRDAPNGLGTEVTATILFEPPGGRIGQAVAKVTGRDPKRAAMQGLRQLKQIMEVGEVATSDTHR